MFLKCAIVVLLLLPLIVRRVKSEDPDKWVWSRDDSGNARQSASPRYEVFENDGGGFRPPLQKPGRPSFGVQGGAGFADGSLRPGQGLYNPQRPGGVYGQGSFRPPRPDNFGNNYGQGSFGLGSGPAGPVLTGPSYSKERPFKYFDSCKCTERFNCNSYGVAYGHCDVGKQYCCYSRNSGPPPSRPVHSPENGILVGPGGAQNRPTGIKPPPRDSFDGNGYGGGNGILVGPGGPTGTIGRPQNNFGGDNGILVGPGGPTGIIGRPPRPNVSGNHPSNGVLVGPGGPFDRPYNNIGSLYGRSSQQD